MSINLIVDSSCDMTENMKKQHNVSIVPLTTTIDDSLYYDDESLQLDDYLDKMKMCSNMTSGSPSPDSFLSKLKKDRTNFVLTISSHLSGSYSSANVARDIANEQNIDVHVFDSKSASAGELLSALKLSNLIKLKLDKPSIIKAMDSYIDEIKTYYVPSDLSNFIKSGRLSALSGKILNTLKIKPIITTDKNGKISVVSKARGEKEIIKKFIDLIRNSGKKTDGEKLVITHCENSEFANSLKQSISSSFNFSEIVVAHTRGLSSMYASTKGVVLAF